MPWSERYRVSHPLSFAAVNAEPKSQMKEHLRKNEAELSELVSEYWRLRHQTGMSRSAICSEVSVLISVQRCIWRH